MTINKKYALAFLIFLIIEIIIALFIIDTIIRPFVDDILVVVLLYCFIRIFIKRKITLFPVYIFLFAVAIERALLFKIVEVLHLENKPFMRTIIGTTFDISDIICYFVGGLLLFLWQRVENKRKNN